MKPDAPPVLIGPGGDSSALERIGFDRQSAGSFDEAWLQRLVHQHPSILPIGQIEPGFGTPVSVCMEMPTSHGPVDNFLITSEGDLILAEVKLWRNPEARRTVVAQALDYASCLNEMDYSELEAAALRGDFSGGPAPRHLYDVLEGGDVPEESAFVDAVNANLSKGRMLILVVGDGITEQASRLGSMLQSHAGARFTFAMVELAVFQMPDGQGRVVLPRTLIKTEMIERGVVHIDDTRAHVSSPVALASSKPESISSEQFYEAIGLIGSDLPGRLRSMLTSLERHGVYPVFLKSLNLKWDPPGRSKPVNMGYITRRGEIWIGAGNRNASIDVSHQYIENLADSLGFSVDRETYGEDWNVVTADGKVPRINVIADRLGIWEAAIGEYVKNLRIRLSDDD